MGSSLPPLARRSSAVELLFACGDSISLIYPEGCKVVSGWTHWRVRYHRSLPSLGRDVFLGRSRTTFFLRLIPHSSTLFCEFFHQGLLSQLGKPSEFRCANTVRHHNTRCCLATATSVYMRPNSRLSTLVTTNTMLLSLIIVLTIYPLTNKNRLDSVTSQRRILIFTATLLQRTQFPRYTEDVLTLHRLNHYLCDAVDWYEI